MRKIRQTRWTSMCSPALRRYPTHMSNSFHNSTFITKCIFFVGGRVVNLRRGFVIKELLHETRRTFDSLPRVLQALRRVCAEPQRRFIVNLRGKQGAQRDDLSQQGMPRLRDLFPPRGGNVWRAEQDEPRQLGKNLVHELDARQGSNGGNGEIRHRHRRASRPNQAPCKSVYAECANRAKKYEIQGQRACPAALEETRRIQPSTANPTQERPSEAAYAWYLEVALAVDAYEYPRRKMFVAVINGCE